MNRLTAVLLALWFPLLASAEDAPRATDAEAVQAIEKLKAGLASADAKVRREAIVAAGGCCHAAVVTQLAPLVREGPDDLRAAAAEALGRMRGLPDPGRALQVAIEPNKAKPAVMGAIARAFGSLNDASAVPLLRDYALAWFCASDAASAGALYGAIEALGSIRSKASMEALIVLRGKCGGGPGQPANVRAEAAKRIAKSVESLTGQKLPQGDLGRWWKQIGPKFRDDMTLVAAAGGGKVNATKK
ncbi:MAG: HEAT repeat domain-containing protein [Planctomycetes bacterium]|nr:HEAT repeat domain-containing protein [Planctomycetota bacterium]